MRRAGVHGDGQAELGGGVAEDLHLVVEPGDPGVVVAGAEIAAGVGRLDPVAATLVLASHSAPDGGRAVGGSLTGRCHRSG